MARPLGKVEGGTLGHARYCPPLIINYSKCRSHLCAVNPNLWGLVNQSYSRVVMLGDLINEDGGTPNSPGVVMPRIMKKAGRPSRGS